jgi:hypothetical protein
VSTTAKTKSETPTAPRPTKVEWLLWWRPNSRDRWRPINLGRSEREVISLITGRGDFWWGPKGRDPNA